LNPKQGTKKLIKSGFLLELKIHVTLKILELGSGKMIKNMIKLEGQSTRQKSITTLHIVKDVVIIFHEVFSRDPFIHSSIRPVIHPWMASYKEENLSRNK
jgi:hypothetical protein